MDMLHLAMMTDGYNEIAFGDPVRCSELVRLRVAPRIETVDYYADNRLGASEPVFSGADLEVQIGGLEADELELIMGLLPIDLNGGILYNQMGMFPFIAVGYRRKMTGETDWGTPRYRYVWIYKARFTLPEEISETVAANVTIHDVSLSGRSFPVDAFAPADYWQYTWDNWCKGASKEVEDSFFERVIPPLDGYLRLTSGREDSLFQLLVDGVGYPIGNMADDPDEVSGDMILATAIE